MMTASVHSNVTTASATLPRTNISAASRASSSGGGGTRKIIATTANTKEHTQRKVCVLSYLWATLLFAAGVLVQGGESKTIVETDEWKACVAKTGGCTTLHLDIYGALGDHLTGTIPENLCSVNPKLYVLYVRMNGQCPQMYFCSVYSV